MFLKINRNIKQIFLDPEIEVINSDENIAVVLSPALYWIKKVELPVKSIREAMPLLPSLFEDQLEDTQKYNYYAYKEDNIFYIFAYNDIDIIELLEKKGLTLQQLKGVYFAQNECNNIEKPLKISKESALIVKDSIVTKVPLAWVDDYDELDLTNHNLTKHVITLKQYGNAPQDKNIYILSLFFILFALFSGIDYYLNQQKLTIVEEKKSKLFQKYQLKPTMFQNMALLKKYTKIDKEQKSIRELLALVLKTSLKPNEKLLKLSYKNKKMLLQFKTLSQESKNKLLTILKSKSYHPKIKQVQKNLYIEIDV